MAGARSRSASTVELLDGDYLHEVGDGETAADARGAGGGQDVIGTGGVIAGGFRTVGADEDAAGMTDAGEQRCRRECEVLGREAVGDFDGFVERADEDDGAVAC